MRAHYSRGTPPIDVLRAREVGGGKKFISHRRIVPCFHASSLKSCCFILASLRGELKRNPETLATVDLASIPSSTVFSSARAVVKKNFLSSLSGKPSCFLCPILTSPSVSVRIRDDES